MAASELARGRKVTAEDVDDEVTKYIFAKEFGWTPSEVDNQNVKDIEAIRIILSTSNKIQNDEMEKMKRKQKAKSSRKR